MVGVRRQERDQALKANEPSHASNKRPKDGIHRNFRRRCGGAASPAREIHLIAGPDQRRARARSSPRGPFPFTTTAIAATYPLPQALAPEEKAPAAADRRRGAGQHGASPATLPPPLVMIGP
jgi:hypothetical protein